MTFSDKLVRLRKINYMTQQDFSKKVGVSRQSIYKWESGQSYPEAMALVKIKEIFGISIDDLLDENYEIQVPDRKRTRKVKSVATEEIKDTVSTLSEKEETVQKEAEEIAAPTISEPIEESAAEEKKVGFFGRIFGRR